MTHIRCSPISLSLSLSHTQTAIPRIQQEAIQDLETCWSSAESTSLRSDVTACLLYAQTAGETDILMHTLLVLFIFAEMLHKLLNDPIIKSRSTLYRLLSKRKAEAQSASQHLRGSMLEARKGLSPDMKIFL